MRYPRDFLSEDDLETIDDVRFLTLPVVVELGGQNVVRMWSDDVQMVCQESVANLFRSFLNKIQQLLKTSYEMCG